MAFWGIEVLKCCIVNERLSKLLMDSDAMKTCYGVQDKENNPSSYSLIRLTLALEGCPCLW